MKTSRLLVFVLPLAAAAAEPPSPLTLAEVLHRVAQRHPSLAARAFDERAATALITQAGQGPGTTLEAEVKDFLGTGRIQGVRGVEATVEAAHTWERGGKRDKRVAAATGARDAVAHEFAAHRVALLAAAASAYVAATTAHQRVELAREPLTLAEESAAALQRRAQAGGASAAETARARAAVALAQAELTRAESAAESARAALAATWGGTPAEAPAFVVTLRPPAALPDETALRSKLASHPRLAVQAATISARRAALALEQVQATADLTTRGGLRFLRDGTDFGFVAGVSLPLPSPERNQGAIRAARDFLAGAEHATRAVEAELHAQFTAAWLDLAAAQRTAAALRRDALPAAVEAEAAVRRSHAAGQLSLLEILDAQRALAALRADIAAAEAAGAAALVRLDALTDRSFPLTTALFAAP